MSRDTITVGVVGVGFAGAAHVRAFATQPGVKVMAIAGRDPARLKQIREQWNIPNVLPDWQSLAACDGLDVVSVAVPNYLHHPVALAALTHGKHVLCEKPLALSLDQVSELVETAQAMDRVLDVVYNHRHREDVQYVADYLRHEGIGPIYHARASWRCGSGLPSSGSWYGDRTQAGGGVLIDRGPHIVDILLALLREPVVRSVSAVTHGALGHTTRDDHIGLESGNPTGSDVDDTAIALLRFADGSSATLELTWAGYSVDHDDINVEFFGTNGGVRLFVRENESRDTVRIFRDLRGHRVELKPALCTTPNGYNHVVRDFLRVVRSGTRHSYHGEFALQRTAVIDACYRSAASGTEVTLSPSPWHG